MTRQPLNILHVGSGFPAWGGTELHLLNLSEQLVKRGHNVTVSCRPGRFVEEQAKQRGLRTVAATVERQHDWHDLGTYRRLMRAENFDVVHVHWSTDYFVAPTAARLSGVPVVLMSRHSPYLLKSALGRYFYEKVLFDRIIALSESVRRTLVGQGLSPQKVTTIHHGTDTAAFARTTADARAVRAEWGIPDGVFVAGMVGRIAPEKGVMTFLDSLAAARDLPLHGVLIGDGPQQEEAREKVRAHGIEDRVTFAGFRQDVNNAIGALDTLVLASVWEEPCSAVVQQAMALSKPVIGTTLGGTPEMIAGNKTGLLVPPGDADALAGAIRTLATDSALSAGMGRAGKERVEALFTLSGMTDKIENLYYEIKNAKAGSPAASRGEHTRA